MSADGQLLITLFSHVCWYQFSVTKRYSENPWEIYHSVVFFVVDVYIMCVIHDVEQ